MMNALFSRLVGAFVLAALLLFSANSTLGQYGVYVDGIVVPYPYELVGHTDEYAPPPLNLARAAAGGEVIEVFGVEVSHYTSDPSEVSILPSVTIRRSGYEQWRQGSLYNSQTITNVTLNDDGWVTNIGNIGTATVSSGGVNNRANANIGTATVSGSGIVRNDGNASIDSLFLNGGLVSNGSRIEDLTYNSGFYTGTYADNPGTIGTLTLAGDSTGIDWGTVDNVVFDSNGSGILSIAAFVEEPIGAANARSRSADVPNISFSGINAEKIDFTDGNVSFDLSGLGSLGDSGDSFFGLFDDGFALSSLFGGANVVGEVNFFQITLGEDFGWREELFLFLNDGELGDDWTFTSTEIVWGEFSGDGNVVPEPATLAILGLGLAGLGLARRRRKS